MPTTELDRLRALDARLADTPMFQGLAWADHLDDLGHAVDLTEIMGGRADDLADIQRSLWHLQRAAGVDDAALATAMAKSLAADYDAAGIDPAPGPILAKPHAGEYLGGWDWVEAPRWLLAAAWVAAGAVGIAAAYALGYGFGLL